MNFNDVGIANNQKQQKNKFKDLLVPGLIFLVVLIVFFAIYWFVFRDNDTEEFVVKLDKDDVLVQILYNRVHDFNRKIPLWMYQNETGSLISNMTESSKMSLVYINLKASDFSNVSCADVPATISGYDSYVCNNVTSKITFADVERTYKELFGENSSVTVSSVIKADPLANNVFVYIDDLDSYVLYNKKEPTAVQLENNYSFVLNKVVNTEDEIKIYEILTNNKLEVNNTIEYVYTFKLDDNGLYTYYSKETV